MSATHLEKRFASKHFHKYWVDSATGDMVCICGKTKGSEKAAPGKYHAIRESYNGYTYDSKLEVKCAMELDWRLKAKEIAGWDKQFPIEIRHPNTNELIRRHKVDFRVREHDGSFTLIEVKGLVLPEYRLLKNLIDVIWLPEHLDYSYEVYQQQIFKRSQYINYRKNKAQ